MLKQTIIFTLLILTTSCFKTEETTTSLTVTNTEIEQKRCKEGDIKACAYVFKVEFEEDRQFNKGPSLEQLKQQCDKDNNKNADVCFMYAQYLFLNEKDSEAKEFAIKACTLKNGDACLLVTNILNKDNEKKKKEKKLIPHYKQIMHYLKKSCEYNVPKGCTMLERMKSDIKKLINHFKNKKS
jgi:TPR repeat protein